MRICIVFLFLTGPFFLNSQSVGAIKNLAGDIESKQNAAGLSAINPWIGAQLVYDLTGSGDEALNNILAIRLLHNINTGNKQFGIPVMGTVSNLSNDFNGNSEDVKKGIKELILSDQGLNIGIYPYYILTKNYASKPYYFNVHGSLSYKLNGFTNDNNTTDADTEYLNSWRISGGLECAYWGKTESANSPISISLTPVLTLLDREAYQAIFDKETESTIFSLELDVTLPLGKGYGVFMQGVFTDESLFRAGIILAHGKKN